MKLSPLELIYGREKIKNNCFIQLEIVLLFKILGNEPMI